MRTIQAARQAVFVALTSPPLTYAVNDGPPITLPAANVSAMPPADTASPPDPLVSVVVGGRGRPTRALAVRRAEIKVSVSTGQAGGDDIVTELYEAVRSRLESPDASGVNPISRAATSTTLPVSVFDIVEVDQLPPQYDPESERTYITATFNAIAQ